MLVGKTAPHFSTNAYVDGKIVRNFSLESYKGKQNVLLIFYPKDFTSLCQSELVAFQEQLSEFEARNTAVIACSTDTADSHAAAARVPQNQGGLEGVTFPIVSDANKTIATNYDVISGDYEYSEEGLLTSDSEMIALRGSFLIDKNGMVQHQLVNFQQHLLTLHFQNILDLQVQLHQNFQGTFQLNIYEKHHDVQMLIR